MNKLKSKNSPEKKGFLNWQGTNRTTNPLIFSKRKDKGYTSTVKTLNLKFKNASVFAQIPKKIDVFSGNDVNILIKEMFTTNWLMYSMKSLGSSTIYSSVSYRRWWYIKRVYRCSI